MAKARPEKSAPGAAVSEDIEDLLGSTGPTGNSLQTIDKMVNEAADLTEDVEALEAELKEAKAKLQEMLTKKLPDALAASGTSNFKSLTTGVSVSVSNFVSGSLPKDPDARQKALKLLDSYDAADLIKNTFSVALPRSAEDQAAFIEDFFVVQGITYNHEMAVHASTLSAFAKARLADGLPIDLDVLGLYTGRIARIKRPVE